MGSWNVERVGMGSHKVREGGVGIAELCTNIGMKNGRARTATSTRMPSQTLLQSLSTSSLPHPHPAALEPLPPLSIGLVGCWRWDSQDARPRLPCAPKN